MVLFQRFCNVLCHLIHWSAWIWKSGLILSLLLFTCMIQNASAHQFWVWIPVFKDKLNPITHSKYNDSHLRCQTSGQEERFFQCSYSLVNCYILYPSLSSFLDVRVSGRTSFWTNLMAAWFLRGDELYFGGWGSLGRTRHYNRSDNCESDYYLTH